MYLDYIWISKYKGIENQGFHFSNKFFYEYDDKTKILTRDENKTNFSYVDNFFGDNIEINAVIGENGCGKTSLMQAIYAAFSKKSTKDFERILLVFRNGAVCSLVGNKLNDMTLCSAFSFTKFEKGCSKIRIEWSNYTKGKNQAEATLISTNYQFKNRDYNSRILSDIRCVYYSNVFDYQSAYYNDDYESIQTNISFTSIIKNYIDNNYSKRIIGEYINANEIIKGFYLYEFRKQIMLLKKLPENYFNESNLPIPKHISINIKEKKTLINDLDSKSLFSHLDILMMFDEIQDKTDANSCMFDRFLNKFSFCLLSSLVYSVSFTFESDITDINDFIAFICNTNKIHHCSFFSLEERSYIVMELLISIIKHIKNYKVKKSPYSAWNIICDLIRTIIIFESPYKLFKKRFISTYSSDLKNKYYKKFYDSSMDQIKDIQDIIDYELNFEIENDLRILSDYALSLCPLIDYIPNLKDNSDIKPISDTELNIALSNNRTNALSIMIELWDRYQSIGIFYDYMFFSWKLSSGEYTRWEMFSRINYTLDLLNRESKNINEIILLFDEADMLLHPAWQQNFIEQVISFLKMLYKNYNFQIIIATHSPIMLSDIPKQNTLLLSKDQETGKIIPIEGNETFAANIFSLYQDSFFIKNTGIGSFAKKKLTEIVSLIHNPDNKSTDIEIINQIDSVGDLYLRAKLKKELLLYHLTTNNEKNGILITQMRTELREKDAETQELKSELQEKEDTLLKMKTIIENLKKQKTKTNSLDKSEGDTND